MSKEPKQFSEFEVETREVFHKIHVDMLSNETTVSRLRKEITTEFLKLPNDYFQDKTCVDLGCGSSVHGTINLLDLGAQKVHGMDMVGNFIGPATKELSVNPKHSGRWQLDVGTLAGLPYPDNKFDFALCQGVIHHVEDDRKAFSEICRILKPGGHAHLGVIAGHGGLFDDIIMGVLVNRYRSDPEFKNMIDGSSIDTLDWFHGQIEWLKDSVIDDKTEAYKNSISFLQSLKALIDKDFILTIRDRLQAPLYRRYHEKEFYDLLKEAGFKSWYRVTRHHIFPNIRKLIGPVYADPASELSKLLYGDTGSNILVVATK